MGGDVSTVLRVTLAFVLATPGVFSFLCVLVWLWVQLPGIV